MPRHNVVTPSSKAKKFVCIVEVFPSHIWVRMPDTRGGKGFSHLAASTLPSHGAGLVNLINSICTPTNSPVHSQTIFTFSMCGMNYGLHVGTPSQSCEIYIYNPAQSRSWIFAMRKTISICLILKYEKHHDNQTSCPNLSANDPTFRPGLDYRL